MGYELLFKVSTDLKSKGKAFQNLGATTSKAPSPLVQKGALTLAKQVYKLTFKITVS